MKDNLLIIGAGIYGRIAKEIATDMGCFGKISFVDDNADTTESGGCVTARTDELAQLADEYGYAAIAIGNPNVRERLADKITAETQLKLVSLVSPRSYVSPSAIIGEGCIIEPMAVVSYGSVLGRCTLVCAGAVINHGCTVGNIAQIDCNATVTGYAAVSDKTKIAAGTVYQG